MLDDLLSSYDDVDRLGLIFYLFSISRPYCIIFIISIINTFSRQSLSNSCEDQRSEVKCHQNLTTSIKSIVTHRYYKCYINF